jgi:hypothetical protein
VITFSRLASRANQDRRAACVHANTELDCFARFRSVSADRALELAYFVVAQRRKACRLPPPQHGEARSVVSPNIVAKNTTTIRLCELGAWRAPDDPE